MSELALIIEDDEDLANIFAEALRGVGFALTASGVGEVLTIKATGGGRSEEGAGQRGPG